MTNVRRGAFIDPKVSIIGPHVKRLSGTLPYLRRDEKSYLDGTIRWDPKKKCVVVAVDGEFKELEFKP